MKLGLVASAAALYLLLGMTVPAHAQDDQQNDKRGKPEKQQDRGRQSTLPSTQQQRPQPQQGPGGQEQRGQRQERREQPAQQPQQQRDQQFPRQQEQQQQQQRVQQQPQVQRSRQQQRDEQPQQQQRQQWRDRQTEQAQRPPQYQQQQPGRTRQQAVAWQQQRGWAGQGAWQGHSTWQQNRAQRWVSDHRSWAQRGGYGGYYIPQATFGIYFGIDHSFRMRSMPTMYMGYPRFAYGGYSFLLVDPWPEYWADNWYATDDVYIDYDDGYYLYNSRYPYVRLAVTVAID